MSVDYTKLSPRVVWGKVVLYLKEHKFIALHVACGDITNVSIDSNKFIITVDDGMLINLLKEGKREMMVSLLDKAPLADGGQPMRQGRDLVGKGLRKLQRYERAHRPAPLR